MNYIFFPEHTLLLNVNNIQIITKNKWKGIPQISRFLSARGIPVYDKAIKYKICFLQAYNNFV